MSRPSPMNPAALTLILAGVVALLAAYTGQFAFGLFPCHFCLLQRYPYMVAIACGLVALLAAPRSSVWKLAVLLGALCLLATAALGAYHTGIERGLIDYSSGCVADTSATGSIDELRAAVMSAPRVSCADASRYFGLSMASWNVLFALGMFVLVLRHYRKARG